MRKVRAAVIGLSLGLVACSGLKTEPVVDKDTQDRYKNGSLLGGEGGIQLLGPRKRSNNPEEGQGIGVNSFLWRASLDTLAFMPIASADPFGGVILTDWYSPPETPNERFKVNVYILDRDLRADGVRASVFRQERVGSDWRDAGV